MISYVHASSYLHQPKQKKKGTFLLFFFCHEKVIKQKIITNSFCPKQQTKKNNWSGTIAWCFFKDKISKLITQTTDQALLFGVSLK